MGYTGTDRAHRVGRAGVAGLALVLAAGCQSDPAPGPLTAGNAHAWAIEARTGSTFTDGFVVVDLNGDQPATITGVSLIGAKGMELVGARVAGPGRGFASIQYFPTWPPRREMPWSKADGATLTRVSHNRGWDLLLGIKPLRNGRLSRQGIRVDYEIDGTSYSRVINSELYVCSSPTGARDLDNRCTFPEGWDETLATDP